MPADVRTARTHAGKVAIVTGAGRGIGRAVTLGLLEAGACVVAVDIDRALFEPDPSLLTYADDITRDETAAVIVAKAIEQFGRLDILVNNAGVNLESLLPPGTRLPEKFWDIAAADFRRVLEVNAVSPFLMTRAAVAPMIAQRWGRVINVTTSLDTMFRQGMIPYGGSKAANEAHSAAMADDLASTGVTLNVLIPGGMVRSRMTASAVAIYKSGLFEPDIMVDPLLWLTSSDADDVTGKRLIAALWDNALPPHESLLNCSAPIAWPQVGKQAIYPAS
jgi:NAD(P)-dependent dehydrogenase (short-subunit alcohol dehydrogenase family)